METGLRPTHPKERKMGQTEIEKRLAAVEEEIAGLKLGWAVHMERQFKRSPGEAMMTLHDLYDMAAEFRAGGMAGGEALHALALELQTDMECQNGGALEIGSLNSEH